MKCRILFSGEKKEKKKVSLICEFAPSVLNINKVII